MNKNWKTCVYAICKNEEQFIDRWVNSMSEADYIVVLDTGSSDNSVEKLKARGVQVYEEIITPWRFDVARNHALNLVPKDIDICIAIDLDQVFNPSWCAKLKAAWSEDTHSACFRYTWAFNADGTEGGVFWPLLIHSRNDFIWTHPVHEVLTYMGEVPHKHIKIDGIQLNHYPDTSKSRGSYLPLLEMAVKDNPTDSRDHHYLGREYMYYQKWHQCIKTLKKYLELPDSIWRDERAASMRYIAKAYLGLNNTTSALSWLKKSINEAPYIRESYIELAQLYYNMKEWTEVVVYAELALQIKSPPIGYINDPFAWGSLPYDLASLAYFNLRDFEKAYTYCKKALALAPTDTRLQNNLNFFTNLLPLPKKNNFEV